jgi:hypothetical protein
MELVTHTPAEAAIDCMEDNHILGKPAVVTDMRPVVRSNLATMTPHLQQRPQWLGLRRPAIRRDRLLLVSGSSIAEMQLSSQQVMMPLKDLGGLSQN